MLRPRARSRAAALMAGGAVLLVLVSPTLAILLGSDVAARGVQDDPPGPAVMPSDGCAMCHDASDDATAMRDASGRSVAPYDLWRSTMMANSARDPFWRAVVSAEMAAAPHAAEHIAETCLGCHAPMAARVGLDDHDTGDPLHALDCEGELGEIARDGVSCTICHGMRPDGLGTPESFTAGFELDPWQRIYGPHEDPIPGPMINHTGFTPTAGAHITSSALCGSCHTLVTETLDAEGKATGDAFHEQTPFLEWRNSDYARDDGRGRTCQDCHVPTDDVDGEPIATRLAHNPGGFDFPFLEERSPFGRHVFLGGNAWVLSILRDNADELSVAAPSEAFDATIAATREQLAERTARLALTPRGGDPGRLAFDVTVTNLTGHRLPTGHPSRRMWLEVVVTDSDGAEVFVSGRVDDRGRIVGTDGTPLATESRGGPVEPHREVVRAADEVARYRAVMQTSDGEPTHTLLRGAAWHVDDRILPRGWRADHPDADAARPRGTGTDRDYAPDGAASGKDRVRYSVARRGRAPFRVRARLLYQSVSPRWIDEIARHETPEIERFVRMAERAGNAPEVLADAGAEL